MNDLAELQVRFGKIEGLRLWQIKGQLTQLPNLLIVVTRNGDDVHHWIGKQEDDQPLRKMRDLSKAQFDELTKDAELIVINTHSMYYRWQHPEP